MDTAREDLLAGQMDGGEDYRDEDGALGSEVLEDACIWTGLSGERIQLPLYSSARLARFMIPDAGNLSMSYFSAKRSGTSPVILAVVRVQCANRRGFQLGKRFDPSMISPTY